MDCHLQLTDTAQAVEYLEIDSSPIPHLRPDSVSSGPEPSPSRLSSWPFFQLTISAPLLLSLSRHLHLSPWLMMTAGSSARASTKPILNLVAPDSIVAPDPRLLDNPSQLAPAVH